MRGRVTAFVALAFVVATSSHAYAVTGTVTQLSTGTSISTQTFPQVSGTNVVWTDTLTASGASDIWYLDLVTGGARDITNTPNDQEFLEDIDGTNIVWSHTNAITPGDVVLYDAATGMRQTIAPSSPALHFEAPAINGRYVVYLRVNAEVDVDGFDTLLGMPFAAPITHDAAVQANPRIYGDVVVYEDYSTGDADVHGFRISTQTGFNIAGGTANQTFPDVDARHVVWISDAGGTDTVWLYDLATGLGSAITSATSHKIRPRVSGSYVVWADDRNGNFDIYLYDIAAAQEQLLVGGSGDQVLADVDGNRIVYTSNDSGFEQVYLYTVAAIIPPPPPDLPFGCDPSKTDLVGSSTAMHRSGHKPAYAWGSFASTAGKDYYVCVDNGKSDGSERTAHFLFAADGSIALTPADFKPNADPPRHVAGKLTLSCSDEADDDDDNGACGHDGHCASHSHHHRSSCTNVWGAAMFGAETPASATVSIRVAK
jgi:beta propeller repeat protein